MFKKRSLLILFRNFVNIKNHKQNNQMISSLDVIYFDEIVQRIKKYKNMK